MVVILALSGAGVAGLLYLRAQTASTSQPVPLTALPAPTPRDAGTGEVEVPSPTESEAESELRQAAGGLSKRPEWASWLAEPHLISRLVAAAHQLAEGNNLPPLLLFFAPEGEFGAEESGGKLFVAREVTARWATVTEVVTSIAPERAAEAYARLAPLFQAAFREIAHPGQRFTPVLHQAIGELLATPVPAQEPGLVKNGAAYFFEDPKLEALAPAQKQLLRMGAANARRAQQWLAALDRALPR